MKRYFILLSVLLALFSCTPDDPVEDIEVYYTSDVEHWSYQLGFKDADLGNSYDSNSYAAIALDEQWSYNWSFIPDIVEYPDIHQLIYSYDTQEYYTIFGKKHYYTVTHSYYAYYSAIVEWDSYMEYKEYQGTTEGRNVYKNLKCTVQYVGYTKETPSQYIPSEILPKVTTYPDSEGEWIYITSGSDTGGSSPIDTPSKREYSYHSSTICYKENGESDDLYIYKNGPIYRASWVYESKGLDKVATQNIHTGPTIIYGVQFMYYINPFGICWYFNFSK